MKVRHWRNFARMKIRIGEISRVGIFFVNGNDDGWVVIRPFVLIVTRYCKSSQQGNRAVSGLSKYIEVFTPVILPSLPGHQPRPDHEQNLFTQELPLFVFSLISFFLIPQILVLILGHSFICRLHDFLRRNLNTPIAKHLSLEGDLLIRRHVIGGRTVSKTREYDLCVVEEFAPNVDFSRTCGFGGEILHLFNTANRGKSFYVIQERTVFLIMPSIEFGSQR